MSGGHLDILGLVPESECLAAQLIARHAETLEGAAEVIAAQARWLRSGTAEDWALARRSVDAVTGPPHHLQALDRGIGNGVCVLRDGHDAMAWLVDDDLVGLEDGSDYSPKRHASPWEVNTEGERALRAFLASGTFVHGLRLGVHEGSARFHGALQDHDLCELVTHLVLAVQNPDNAEVPVVERFPALRGLSCLARELPVLLASRAPALRSLTVADPVDLETLDRALARAPALTHLALRCTGFSEAFVRDLLRRPFLARLRGLELWDRRREGGFPLAAWRAHEASTQHLVYVGLAEWSLPERDRPAFARRPGAFLIRSDRRDVVALDADTSGWTYRMF
ncbi:MAG: hypothetical protein AAF447_00145 [Myxococcota bacterium]